MPNLEKGHFNYKTLDRWKCLNAVAAFDALAEHVVVFGDEPWGAALLAGPVDVGPGQATRARPRRTTPKAPARELG
jgi:hypothetical protein